MQSYIALRAALVCAVFAVLLGLAFPADAQTIPADAKVTCSVSSGTFDTWFGQGHPALNGFVKPADSVTFSHANNCAFFAWSKQMFLWLTSPAPSAYGGRGIVLNSPVFYDVSPPDSNGVRHFLPHTPGFLPRFTVRGQKPGPMNVPILVTKSGQVLRFRDAAPGQRPMVRGAGGVMVEVKSASNVNGHLALTDVHGKKVPLAVPRLIATVKNAPLKQSPILTRFFIHGIPIFIDPFGNPADPEEGQATGDVLLAQNGSLVYYTISVNNVYAYFLTGAATGGIVPTPTQFPTTQPALQQVINYAATQGQILIDPDALAIEVKASWVEASQLPNAGDYITEEAIIPTYDKSNPNDWKVTGEKTTTLAMVGMHVVGSAAGHPEMIWSTFEHFNNAPNASYQYINQAGVPVTVPQSISGTWLFAKSNASSFDVSHAQVQGSQIVSTTGQVISPSDTLRVDPFGSSLTDAPNPLVTTAAASNTEVISIHNNISAMMPAGDIRSAYYMTGSTWTNGGVIPTSNYGNVHNPTGTIVGTSQINNATMETYFQADQPAPSSPPYPFKPNFANCMICHSTNGTNGKVDTGVSHIYDALQPLPTVGTAAATGNK